MTSSPASIPADPQAQYLLVHEGIQAVAARCDGAVSLDFQGFDGQDTHYGRRISSVPFEKLTDDDKVEIARIANKYREQIERYTDVDVRDFPVVLAAKELTTNHQSRQNARRYEKLSAFAAARKVTLLANGKVGLAWDRKDPDFGTMLEGVKALPGRTFNWDTKTNEVPASEALLAFASDNDMEVPADVLAAVAGAQAAAAAAPKVYNVGLLKGSDGKRLWIKADYNADRVADARSLPGRRWNGAQKMDEVDASPAVLAFAEKWGLEISPKAQAAINEAGEEEADAAPSTDKPLDRAGLLSLASRAGGVTELPAEFIALVNQAVGQ